MGLTASMIDAMVASGCSAEQMAAIMKADLEEQEKGRIARLEAQRAGNAERQQRFRDKRVTRRNRSNALRAVTPPIEEIIPPVSSSDETQPAPKAPGIAKPVGVKDQTWIDFQRVRKAKKAPLTQTAMDGIEREASAAGWSMESALAECVTRNWQAFKAEWVSGKPAGANDGSYLDHLSKSRAQGQ